MGGAPRLSTSISTTRWCAAPSCCTIGGVLKWPPPKPEPVGGGPQAPVSASGCPRLTQTGGEGQGTHAAVAKAGKPRAAIIGLASPGSGWACASSPRPIPAGPELAQFLQHLTVFVLACFVGWQVIWSVTAALHTP
jgi:NAD(P) transhydrogenase subunit alpha